MNSTTSFSREDDCRSGNRRFTQFNCDLSTETSHTIADVISANHDVINSSVVNALARYRLASA